MSHDVSFAVRVPADLLAVIKSRAKGEDMTVSQVIRRLLRQYVGQGPAQLDIETAIAASRPAKARKAKR